MYLSIKIHNIMDKLTLNTTPPLPTSPRPIVAIGAGGIVNNAHLPAYKQAGFPVAGIFDLDLEKAQTTAATFGIPNVYSSLAEVVTNAPTDAVFDVALPASALPATLPRLPDKAAVLIQKPMGESLREAKALLDICQQKQLGAAMNFQLRYAPFVLAAHDLIEQGLIGDLVDVEIRAIIYTPWHLWGFLEDVTCMEVYYHSIHYLDYMRACLGNPHGVYAKVTNHPIAPKLDGVCSSIILDYSDRVRANIQTNHIHQYGLEHQESYIKWEGTRGAIKAKMGLLMDYPVGVPDAFSYCLLQGDEPPVWQNVDIPGSWFPEAFVGTMASVMRFAEGSADTIPTAAADAYQTMVLVDAVQRSSATVPRIEWGK